MSETRKRKKEKLTSKECSLVSENIIRRKASLVILSKVVIFFAALILVCFHFILYKPFAKQSEFVKARSQIVDCSKDYVNEIKEFDGCVPKQCKRVVTDNVISRLEAYALLTVAKKGLALGGSSGGASILNLHSGALSMGQHFVNLYKLKGTENLFTDADFKIYNSVKEKAKHAVALAFDIDPNKLYLADPSFFSQISSKEAVTIHDEYWHRHVDKETYQAFHYTTLLYLGDYSKDFEGGRFFFVDNSSNGIVEPRMGRLLMFSSGKENPHFVEKVTSGVRYALTLAFTCDEKKAVKETGTQ